MIKASELRIGNLLKYRGLPNKVNAIDNYCYFEGITYGISFNKLEPIPLTEEWILRHDASLLVQLEGGYKRYNINGIQLSISPERNFFIEYVHQIPMKYVHTFQNFYFATKQIELEVKP